MNLLRGLLCRPRASGDPVNTGRTENTPASRNAQGYWVPAFAGTTERRRWEDGLMKDLIKQYLDNGISRRKLMTGLSALGMSSVAVKAMAQSLSTTAPASAMREVQGTGGALFVQQLK